MVFSRRQKGVRVFVNYRKDDAASEAGRLYDDLSDRYGDDRVFMDTDTIGPGEDYREVLGSAVGRCDVLLAVIGPGWLTATDESGSRRLDKPDDWVRIEIESALDQGMRVIPVLVDGAHTPKAAELPESLEPLAHRQTMSLGNSGHQWRYDVSRLMSTIEKGRPSQGGRERSRPSLPLVATLVAVVAAAVLVPLLLFVVLQDEGVLGRSGDIAFTRNDGIYRMDAAGEHTKRIYQTGRSVTGLTWSPDAKRIAFAMDGDIWLLGSSGGPKNLTNNPELKAASPAFSPDGKHVAFAAGGSSAQGLSGIALVGSDGGDVRFLLQDGEFDAAPAWSPDGTRIAFSTARDEYASQRTKQIFFLRSIYELRVASGTIGPLVDTSLSSAIGIVIENPDYSPDGKKIVFSSTAGPGCSNGCIYTYTFGSRKFDLLATPPASSGTFEGYSRPRWLDDRHVLFGYQNGVWTVSTAGEPPERIGTDTDIFNATVARAPKDSGG